MTAIQFPSTADAPADAGARLLAAEACLRSRVVRMGLLLEESRSGADGDAGPLLEALEKEGLCLALGKRWRELPLSSHAERVQLLEQAYQALEDIPTPSSEWAGLRDICGDLLLERLLAISPASLRRYAAGGRRCPDGVAVRLHWLTLVVEALEGTYNPIGIRRWFERPREALKGAAPLELLTGPWLPEHPGPQRVRALAEAARGGMVAS